MSNSHVTWSHGHIRYIAETVDREIINTVDMDERAYIILVTDNDGKCSCAYVRGRK